MQLSEASDWLSGQGALQALRGSEWAPARYSGRVRERSRMVRRCTSLWAALGRRAIARFPPGEGVWNRRVPREQKSPAGVPGRRSKRSGGRIPTPQRGRRLRENANSTCSGDVAPPVASEKRRAEAAGLRRNKRPKRALAVGDGRLPGAGREYCCCLPNYSPGAQSADEREKPQIRRANFRF